MKKLLLASTALVASASIAAAEVAISGSAEIGIFGGDDIETQFHTDIDVTFSMTGESDGGLAFGASVDLDESDGDPSGAFEPDDDGGATWFLAYNGLRLDMGDTDGAFDAALQEVALASGSIQDDETAHAGYNGNSGLDGTFDGQIARVSYNFDAFTGHFSLEIDDSGDLEPIYGIGVRYSGELGGLTLGVGIGYQTQEDTADLIGISIDTDLASGFSAAINYTDESDEIGEDGDHWAIGFGYSQNAFAIGINYGEFDDFGTGDTTASGFGLAASYDLGGGLEAQFGYGYSDVDGADEDNTYSLGLSMSF